MRRNCSLGRRNKCTETLDELALGVAQELVPVEGTEMSVDRVRLV